MRGFLDWDTPPRLEVPELIDDETQPYTDFQESLRDVQRVNRFLGGTAVLLRPMKKWLRFPGSAEQSSLPLTILDVATGSGDLPKAIAALASAQKIPVHLIGLDFSPPILRFAREETQQVKMLRLLRGDAFQLPFADASIDYVLCSLAFHHFGFEGSVSALREMERVSRRGWVVNDLRRARSAWWLFRAVSRITRMNRLTRHDGPASVLRAYSLPEYKALPEALGLTVGEDVQLYRSAFYRVALVREKIR